MTKPDAPIIDRRLNWSAAFTLVELLAVVGIISVLVAILLPALQRARAAAQRVSCASNYRQIGILTTYYHNDNKLFFPPFYYGYVSPTNWGPAELDAKPWIAWYVTHEDPYTGPFVQRNKLFICPASEGLPDAWGDGDPNAALGAAYNYGCGPTSVNWNEILRGSAAPTNDPYTETYFWNYHGPGIKVPMVRQPARVIWAIEGWGRRFDDTWYGRWFIAWNRHGGQGTDSKGVNAVFVDGHVEWISYNTLAAFTAGGAYPYLWR